MATTRRLIVAITGATGAVYGVRLLQVLRETAGVETHLMVSDAGVLNLHQELDMNRKDVEALAHVVHTCAISARRLPAARFNRTG